MATWATFLNFSSLFVFTLSQFVLLLYEIINLPSCFIHIPTKYFFILKSFIHTSAQTTILMTINSLHIHILFDFNQIYSYSHHDFWFCLNKQFIVPTIMRWFFPYSKHPTKNKLHTNMTIKFTLHSTKFCFFV